MKYEEKYIEQIQTDIEGLIEQVKYLMSVVAFLEDARIMNMPMFGRKDQLFDIVGQVYMQHMKNKYQQ